MVDTLIYYAYAAFGLYVLILSIHNIATMKAHTFAPKKSSNSMVSVMIPVRDEAQTIGSCLDSLLDQTYENYEILVIDDHSSDQTWEIISDYAKTHNNIRVFSSKVLPKDWNGKTHALHQVEKYASGEMYLFTDADTIHSRESISFGSENLKRNSIDLISGYPLQKSSGLVTQLIISIMHFSTAFLFPLSIQYHTKNPVFSLAIGQYIFITKKAYRASGGHEQIKGAVTDDIHLAREVVKHGFKQGFIDIRHMVSCTMYHTPKEAFCGIARSIIAFFDKNIGLLLASVFLFTIFAIYPSLVFFWSLFHQVLIIPVLIGYVSIALAWGIVSIYHRYSPVTVISALAALILPVIMILYGVMIILTKRELLWKNRPVL